MMKTFPGVLLGLSLLLGRQGIVPAQEKSQGTALPPKVLVIFREFLKPGKGGNTHEKAESAFVQAFSRAKWPTHYLALDSLSGTPRTLFLTGYDSFEAWEKDSRAAQKNATLSAALERAGLADGDLLSSADSGAFAYRDEYSLRPQSDASHMRYFEISVFHVRPGRQREWADLVRLVTAASEKIPEAHWATYEAAYGTESGSYLVFTPIKSAVEIDRAFAQGKQFEVAMGEEGMKKLSELSAVALESTESNLFVFNPRMSYVADEWVQADPDFWKPAPAQLGKENYQTVKVFYVTDRQQANNAEPFQYSSKRSPDGEMHFGTAFVSIPRDRKMGELETASLFRVEFRNDPEKHITLLNVVQEPQGDFLRDVRDRLKNDPSKEVLIFIHGYNVTFEDAARRLAQITYDLAFPGAPILYSWPSKGTYFGYFADETTVQWSIPHFKNFLENLAKQSGASAIHVIAHSMGNHLLVGALNLLATEHKTLRPALQQVVLAAPDIDSGVFRQIAAAVSQTGSHFTIYESSADEALKASHRLHDYLRLGDSQPNVQIIDPYDTIDATRVDTGFFRHSYFADNKSILADIFYLIQGKPPTGRFGIERKTFRNQVYWAVKP